MPRGRQLSLLLLAFGVFLLSAGVAAVVAVCLGQVVGIGVGVAILGVGLITTSLFLVPVDSRPDAKRPIR